MDNTPSEDGQESPQNLPPEIPAATPQPMPANTPPPVPAVPVMMPPPMPQVEEGPRKGGGFFKVCATYAWVSVVLAFACQIAIVKWILGAHSRSHIMTLLAALPVLFFWGSGLLAGIIGLCGMPKYGRKGLLAPALTGVLLWVGLCAMAVAVPNFLSARQRAMTARSGSGSKSGAVVGQFAGGDTSEEQMALSREARALVKAEKWDEIEKEAAELRTSKAKFLSGEWKLAAFYVGLSPKGNVKSEVEWKEAFERLDRWKAAAPGSITQCVVRGSALTGYAWFARGGGWADSVTEEGWKNFKSRLAEARQVLEDGKQLGECPQWYCEMQTVALGQGWDRAEYEKMYQQAVAAEPTYYGYYTSKSYYLLPRWYGKEGDAEAFADEAVKEDAAEGMAVYARIVWSKAGFYDNIFKESRFEWAKAKQGFRDMERVYPVSESNVNHFFKLAVLAEDKEMAAELLNRLVKPEARAWSEPGDFEKARAWAQGK